MFLYQKTKLLQDIQITEIRQTWAVEEKEDEALNCLCFDAGQRCDDLRLKFPVKRTTTPAIFGISIGFHIS